ncbi:type IV secretion system protein [Candidatus Kaiserbacteria bacterium]|nr:type IV secretion system protein [Candidatus Kaiserbacteria bacterium]
MKKFILISLILTFLYTPLSFGVDSQSISLEIYTTKALAQETTTPVQKQSDADLAKKGLARGKDGIIRSSHTWADVFENNINALMENIALLPIFISSFFVYIAGQLLNFTVLETVLKFGTHFTAIEGIDSAWGTLRDLANIFFIFGLLTIAISTILGATNYGYKKLLARLIIVALIINFSLFFTKFVIDSSNIFALQFYQGASVSDSDGSNGIANTFMQHLGVTSIWETDNVLKTLNELNYSPSGGFGLMFLYSIFTSIFLMITAFVFIFAAIMLITRAVGFILLAILSPLAFAAFVVPNTQKWTDKWWSKLWQYAIFAPVLLMLFWVIANIIPDITATFVGKDAGLLDSFSPNPQERSASIGMMLNFIILISLMLASIMIANELSIKGSEGLTKVGKNLGKFGTRTALRLPFGLAGAFGRATVGRGAKFASESNFAGRMALRSPKVGGALLRGLQGTAKSSFDARKPLGNISGAANFVGKPQEGGYQATLKKMEERRHKTGEDAIEAMTKSEIDKGTLDKKDKEKRKNELREEYAKNLETGVAQTVANVMGDSVGGAVNSVLGKLDAAKLEKNLDRARKDPALSGFKGLAAAESEIKNTKKIRENRRARMSNFLENSTAARVTRGTIKSADFVIDQVISPSIYDANMKVAKEMRKHAETNRGSTATSEALKTFNRESQKRLNEIQSNIDDVTLKLKHAEDERKSIAKNDTARSDRVEKTIKDLEAEQLETKRKLRETRSDQEETKNDLQNKERKAKEAKQEFNKEKKS